jgi:hypothetical protein
MKVLCAFAIGAAALVTGCSSQGGKAGDVAAAPTAVLEARDLLLAASGGGRPPTKITDLNKYRTMSVAGYEAIKNGEVVVLWGTASKKEGDIAKGGAEDVLAYEKETPTNGGYVVLSGGTIKKMTAAEFAAAPKSGKP